MDLQTQYSLKTICLESSQYQGNTKEYEVYDNNLKIRIQVTFTNDNKIIYTKNGVTLRVEKIKNLLETPEILTNLEQIKHLKWQGEYDLNQRKSGRWIIKWQGKIFYGLGGYFVDGLKQGLWRELMKNYDNKQAQGIEIGEYYNDKRIGKWMFFYKFMIFEKMKIASGQYNQQGKKQGKWIDLSDRFRQLSQVFYIGVYNKNGYKVGRWDIMYKGFTQQKQKFMQVVKILSGGGQYDEQNGISIKIGRWIEEFEGFADFSQVIYDGEYNMNGLKQGRWDFIYQGQQIGGGRYQEQGKKIGKWIELSEGFQYFSQITYQGEYNKNSVKVGRWEIMFCKYYQKDYLHIGGGQYDEQSEDSTKIGKWIELSEGFSWESQITYNGEYNSKGKKVGIWEEWDIQRNEKRQEIKFDD